MTQTIEYVVKVNATQAQAAVAEVEKRFGGVDTVVARVDKSIIALERDMKDLNAAIAAGGPNVAAYQKELDNLGQAAGRAAGNKNMGQGMLQLSQTFDDLQYGIKGVVNNIPGLVQGFGVSAGIAGGAQLAFIAVNQLTDKLTDYIKKQQEASQAAIKGRLSLLDARVQAMQETADLQAELDRITAEISGGTGKVTEDASKARLADLRTNITNAEQDIAKRQGQLQMLERMQFRSDVQDEQIKATKAYIQDRRNRIAADNAAIDQETKNQEIRVKIAKASEELANKGTSGGKKTTKPSAGGTTAALGVWTEEDEQNRELELRASTNAWLAKMRDDSIKMGLKAEQDAQRASARIEADKTKAAQHEARERERIRDDEAAHAKRLRDQEVQALQRMGSDAAAAIGTFAAEAAMGQEDAFQNLLGAASQQAGGMIMLKGGEVMAAGIAGMLAAPNPASAAQIAGGAALVAAGAAVQTGGPAAVSALMGASGGRTSGDRQSTRDPGASPRSSGGGGGGGPMIINVSYGAGGPLPEDIAREIHKVTSSGNRRRGAA